MEETTLFMQCDVIEPADGKGYDRDPRSIAKRAEAYLKSSGMGDTAYFGPEPEFFIFDSVRWKIDMSGCFVKIDSEEAVVDRQGNRRRQQRPPSDRQGRLLPGAPVDSFQDMRSEMCLILESLGIPVEVHHHEVAGAGQNEIGTKFSTLVSAPTGPRT
jgi:glutamine synthetase